MASDEPKKPSISSLVADFVAQRAGVEIDHGLLDDLVAHVAAHRGGRPPSRARLFDVLMETDAPVSAALGGYSPDLRDRIRIRDLDSARPSLIEMAVEYERAREAGDKRRQGDCRRTVLHAQQKLSFLLSRPNLSDEKRTEKQELQTWLRTWLEAPSLFEGWVALRRRETGK